MATQPPVTWQQRLGQEVVALLLLGLALFVLLALASYSLADPQGLTPVWSAARVGNWGGKAGAFLAWGGIAVLGLGAFLLPVLLFGLAWQCHRQGLDYLTWPQVISSPGPAGGNHRSSQPGAPLHFLGARPDPQRRRPGECIGGGARRAPQPPRGRAGAVPGLPAGAHGDHPPVPGGTAVPPGEAGPAGLVEPNQPARPRDTGHGPARGRSRGAPDPHRPAYGEDRGASPAAGPPGTGNPSRARPPSPGGRRPTPGKFTLPSLDLLDAPKPWDHQVQEGQMMAQAEKLEATLRHFGVEGKVTAIIPGPVVSRFELEPAPGVKISRVTNLSDDLALALKALSIRIVAPVPGKAVIGIEIPNPKRQVVALQEILADAGYKKNASPLTVALGKDIMGTPVVSDLAKMPHLLIAGATGSGKSVGLNAMILSILYKATPEQVRFLLIDPKRIELSTYQGIPHLLHPVVVNPREATIALHWAVNEMEKRYALLSDLGVRNVEGYNQKAKNMKFEPQEDGELPPPRSLPYIVVVIDELADLMLVASRDTEEYLIRLAQKARASGIHLLVATQRPSVDVITGLIKANFPTRISYQVSSKADARVILDTQGAERLLGKGDLLFIPPGTSRLTRIHGPYVSDEEVERVVEFLKEQATPEFEPGIMEMQVQEQEEEDQGERDEKWDEALALVAETRNASISMLQRRLRIGYNRAARIVETMEREGLVGPSDGLKSREVYIPRR